MSSFLGGGQRRAYPAGRFPSKQLKSRSEELVPGQEEQVESKRRYGATFGSSKAGGQRKRSHITYILLLIESFPHPTV